MNWSGMFGIIAQTSRTLGKRRHVTRPRPAVCHAAVTSPMNEYHLAPLALHPFLSCDHRNHFFLSHQDFVELQETKIMRSASLVSLLFFFASSNAFSVTENFPAVKHSGKRVRPYSPSNCRSSYSSLESTFTASNSDINDLEFDWKETAKEVFAGDKRPIILFDGVCNLCNGGVNFALDHDADGKFRFASLQSKAGQSLLIRSGKKPNDISSIVLVTPEDAYFKSDAVLRIAAKLNGNPLLPLAGNLGFGVPGFVRNIVYDFVARNRYRFGEADQCRMDFDNEFGSRFISDEL